MGGTRSVTTYSTSRRRATSWATSVSRRVGGSRRRRRRRRKPRRRGILGGHSHAHADASYDETQDDASRAGAYDTSGDSEVGSRTDVGAWCRADTSSSDIHRRHSRACAGSDADEEAETENDGKGDEDDDDETTQNS